VSNLPDGANVMGLMQQAAHLMKQKKQN